MKICIIIPCYNEEKRLDLDVFSQFITKSKNDLTFCFVNDGSSDRTAKILAQFAATNDKAIFVDQEKNQGKAAAIRTGMREVYNKYEFDLYGYWDADLATPLEEIDFFTEKIKNNANILFVIGSRINRLGADVKRAWYRHILGRLFATVASICLKIPVYDTQCGAKLISNKIVRELFEEKFISYWIFDIELIFRFKNTGHGIDCIYEQPVETWHDIGGSKLRLLDFLKAPLELIRIYWKY